MNIFKLIISILAIIILSACVNNTVRRGPVIYSFTKTDNKNEYLTYQSVSIFEGQVLTNNIINLLLCKVEDNKMICQKLDTTSPEKEIEDIIKLRNKRNEILLKSNEEDKYIR